jgi:RNA recognition motif-containing protein
MKNTHVAEDDEDVHTNPEMESEDPNATAKEIDVAQITKAVGSLALNPTAHANINPNAINGANSQGNTSPQLPSPSSGSGASVSAHSVNGVAAVSSSSSSSLRHAAAPSGPIPPNNFTSQNTTASLSHLSSMLSSTLPGLVSGVDQNPPINTLYVGNLPISPPPLGYPPDILEDSLRELFRTRPGYRRLSFKQKSTGPMCFVEFEDVNAATKTINELYGNTLNGLVKGGGIRLSYSKNPLGVRTPTSANGPGGLQQQQHIQQQIQTGRDADRERGGYGGAQALSPTPHHHSSNHRASHTHEYMISPPPPRFAGTSAGVNQLSNMSFGNFSLPFGAAASNIPAGSASSNFMFGTADTFQGGAGAGAGYRFTSSDPFGDAQGQGLNSPFAPFDGHLDHPAQLTPLSMQHQGPNPNQNQNF